MEFTNNEKIIIGMALEVRREKWITVARDRIEYLKEIGADITNDEHVDYFVNCVNECARLIGKIRRSYVSN